MSSVIYEKIRNVRIGDTSIKLRIRNHDNSIMTSGEGAIVRDALNGINAQEFVLTNIGWTFCYGQENYPFHSFWQQADFFGSWFLYETSYGDYGYISDTQDNGNNYGSARVGHWKFLEANQGYEDTFEVATGYGQFSQTLYRYCKLITGYWEVEDFSYIVEVPLPLNYFNTETISIENRSESSLQQDFQEHMGASLTEYGENLEWLLLGDLNNTGTMYADVLLEQITTEFLLGFKFSTIQNRETFGVPVQATIDSPDYNTGWTSYVPFKITAEAPDYNFSLSLNSIADLPSTVTEGETVEGSINITSHGFSGTLIVRGLDHEDDVGWINEEYGTNLGEDDQAQYGVIQDYGIGITTGTFSLPIQYTAGMVGVGQTDSYSIVIEMQSLNSSYYGEYFHEAEQQFLNLPAHLKLVYTDAPQIQVLDIGEVYVEEYNPSENMIERPCDVLLHLIEQELAYNGDVDFDSINESRDNDTNLKLGFSVNKKIKGKKLIQEISKSSDLIPTLASGRLRFINFKSTYNGNDNIPIKEEDIIQYQYSRTKLESLKTQIEIKYQHDLGLKDYLKTSGKLIVSESYFLSGTYSDYVSGDIENNNYYGVKEEDWIIDHIDTQLVIENKYIRNQETAANLANHILAWNKNQHNIITLTLPLKYYNLEIGDLVEFDRMILGKKLYNESYVLDDPNDMPIRCGQYILPMFMITSIDKKLNNIQIKVTQMHHLSNELLNYKNNTYTPIQQSFVAGDFNLDGVVNVLDVVGIVNLITTDEEISPEQFVRGDFNQDGYIDILDLVAMIGFIIDNE